MRARNKIYHIDCFRCVACSRQLVPGDEFALREDGLFCKEDHEIVEKATATAQANHARTNSNPRNTSSGGKLFSYYNAVGLVLSSYHALIKLGWDNAISTT